MKNRDLEATWAYHDATKHSVWSIRNDPHYLDFDNQPLPFKIYPELEPIPLPHDRPVSTMTALSAISTITASDGTCIPDKTTLASLLNYSAGITKRSTFPGGEMVFRAAACTGALYHIELYLVCGDLPDLPAGVYHFGVQDFALRKLREGDFRRVLSAASGQEPSIAHAPAMIVCTGTYWRNSWKYRSRTYRHCFWDNGTILANLLAISTAHAVPARVVMGFVDDTVNRLLDLDTDREVALSLVPLGYTSETTIGDAPDVRPLNLSTVPLSRTEEEYPLIGAMHEASSLTTEEEARVWRGSTPATSTIESASLTFSPPPLAKEEAPTEPIEKVIVRRGSSRQFLRQPISSAQLITILQRSTQGVPADFLEPEGTIINDLYLIVHAVEGLPAGAYLYHRDENSLELLKEGDFRQMAGHLGLGQAIPADASADVFFLADLNPLLDRYGNRAYRATQMEAGIIGGKMYLAAYAQKLGASGLTFFDDDVISFFSPHAEGKSVMFLVALGRPLRKRIRRPDPSST